MSSIDGSPGGDPSSFFGGSGSQTGIMGLGQFHADPYQANGAAFAPDANENAYISQLQGMANGTAPSAAQMQMQQGLQQATGQAQALAASQRGISPALAARYAGLQQSGMQQGVAANTSVLRAQEQQQAMGNLGNELQSVRAGRMGLENLNSGNQNFATGANLQGYTSAAANRGNFMSGIGNTLQGGALMGAKGGMATQQGFVLPPQNQPTDSMGKVQNIPHYAQGGTVIDPGSFNHTPNLGPISPPAKWEIAKGGGGGGGTPGDEGASTDGGDGTPWETGGGMAGGAGDAGGITGGASAFAFAADGGEVEVNGPTINPGDMNHTPSVPSAAAPSTSVVDTKSGGGGGGGIMSMLPMLAMAASKGGQIPNHTSPNEPKSHTARFLKQALAGGVQHMSFGGMSGEGPGWGQMVSQNAGAMFGGMQQPQQVQGTPPTTGPAPGQQPKPGIPNGGQQNLSGKTGTQNPGMATGNVMGQDYQYSRDPGYQFFGKSQAGGMFGGMGMKSGGPVPGQAPVKGDSLQNDKVPTMLSPKEIVIPRSITLGKNPGDKAKAFVDKIMASHNKGKKNGSK